MYAYQSFTQKSGRIVAIIKEQQAAPRKQPYKAIYSIIAHTKSDKNKRKLH
jgi:hypothetical protein